MSHTRVATCHGPKSLTVERCVKRSKTSGLILFFISLLSEYGKETIKGFSISQPISRAWEEAYWNLTFYDYESIVSKTECRRPCTYHQYKFIGDTFGAKIKIQGTRVLGGPLDLDICYWHSASAVWVSPVYFVKSCGRGHELHFLNTKTRTTCLHVYVFTCLHV